MSNPPNFGVVLDAAIDQDFALYRERRAQASGHGNANIAMLADLAETVTPGTPGLGRGFACASRVLGAAAMMGMPDDLLPTLLGVIGHELDQREQARRSP